MKKCLLILVLCVTATLGGCTSNNRPHRISQIATIDALLGGVYDGHITCRELLKHGNFGIGTFDRLDGEMLVLDGKLYQIKADGRVYTPDIGITTPFATVCDFQADQSQPLEPGQDFKAVTQWLDRLAPNQNVFCAIKITGQFVRMETRSVPAQTKPYQPLAEVTKNQPKFAMQNVEGTIVGFRCPPYMKGLNVPGYHLHFLSADRTQGGHILSFEVAQASCEVDICDQFELQLPQNESAFETIDLSKDRSADLQKAEK